jgi:7,8-dihydropterin-6-yl-methyl-4-(beta-D-ribofuranosyl)aminobenzene 5'-phosphate synthase
MSSPSSTFRLPELDDLTVQVVIDNTSDPLSSGPVGIPQQPELAALLAGGSGAERLLGRDAMVVFDRFCIACHGFSALVTGRAGRRQSSVLFDVGPYGDIWLANAKRLSLDLADIEAVVLSHWHWDHSGAMIAVVGAIADARRKGGREPVVVDVHPDRPDQRGFLTPAGVFAMFPPEPLLDDVARVGAEVVSRADVHRVADLFLVSGDIPRTTGYETGFPGHHSWRNGQATPDPECHDERFLAAHVRGRGVTVLSACSHAGVVNASLEARRLVGQPVDLVLGGYHLAGAGVEPRIEPTVRELVQRVQPRIIAPAHCTGWRALSALAAAAGIAGYAPSAVGARYLLTGSPEPTIGAGFAA